MIVYHLLGKSGWSTVEGNGTGRLLNGHFQGGLIPSFHFQYIFSKDRINDNPSQKARN